ncbi:MAG: glycerol-3-phosphate 1-O-acyltransferase PlsY [bacterium]|nr:glycerol-3-phosphate 1-O-acyltransferase PlsY [bacterium]MDD5354081.1 glycerol-3-phosphate 1-O-acyltransferase PlsY [bacterium]
MILNAFLIIAGAYLIGSIPTAFLAGKLLKGIDIRQIGSGNIGATNVFRSVGKTAGVVVLAFDMLKGVVPVLLAGQFAPGPCSEIFRILAGLAAICGHNWTIFLNFKGGKGVATSTGVLLTLAPVVTLAGFLVFVLAVTVTRYISLGSMIAASAVPLLVWYLNPGQIELFCFVLVIAILIDLKHIPNIKRLIKHEEHKFSFATKAKSDK